jgi:uncharacterized protein (TIGR03437 family)
MGAFLGIAFLFMSLPAYCGEGDALAIVDTIEARHLPFGTILDPIFTSPASDQVVGYTRCGDSAIWTGHFIAAEAFRYRVTHASDALDNVKNAIAGVKSLVDVTNTNLLARCLVPIHSAYLAGIESEEAHNGIHTNNSANAVWIGNTSRDQYSGVMFGLAVAYDMVDEGGVRNSASDLITRLVDFLQQHAWNVVMPDGSISTTFLGRADQILSFLQVARHVNPSRFSDLYNQQSAALAATVAFPIGLEVLSDGSYFKFNLDYINLYDLLNPNSGTANSAFLPAYRILRDHTAGHQNAFFNMIDRAISGPNATRDAETLALLDAWLQRPRRDKFTDLHGVVPVCGDRACQPVPVALRPPTDFLWQRDPFQLAGGGQGLIESAGIDYILPYWMARFYAITPQFTVQSSAAGMSTVAPESLASIYGSQLASLTQQAASQPLPMSLAGVTLNVRDAGGVTRPAALIYVSPGQINFLVPQGTAPGTATFIIQSGGTSRTVTGTVRGVAPTLFSMSGNGAGVAAATALRVDDGNPSEQSPIQVFECGGSGCVSTPIQLDSNRRVIVSLYGTGLRNRTALSNVTATINGVSAPVLYAGPQPQFPGLDQVNVELPLSLRGKGESNILLTADGQTANVVTINIK